MFDWNKCLCYISGNLLDTLTDTVPETNMVLKTLRTSRRRFIAVLAMVCAIFLLVVVFQKGGGYKNLDVITDSYEFVKRPVRNVLNRRARMDRSQTTVIRRTIPKIIHQIWNNDTVPNEFVMNVKAFVTYNPYPEWDYYFWTYDTGREFIKQKFPDLLAIYDCSDIGTKPDILRILMIYYYGGAYFDLDVVNVRPLNPFVDSHECAVNGPVPEHQLAYDLPLDPYWVNNAIFLCRPYHPFFTLLVSRTAERTGFIQTNGSCPRPEFPYPLLLYIRENGLNDSLPEVVDYFLFEPIYDLTVTGILRNKCSGDNYKNLESSRKVLCDNWRRLGEDKRTLHEHSYTAHTWFHTSINKVTFSSENRILNLVPHVKIFNAAVGEMLGGL